MKWRILHFLSIIDLSKHLHEMNTKAVSNIVLYVSLKSKVKVPV